MKRKVLYSAILILLLTLWGCSAKETPTPETTAVQTEAVTVPTEPTETEAKHNVELFELDTSEYDFTFEKVLLRIDWTDMTFALKCFDGSVVTGTVEKDSSKILLQHENGRMILQSGVHNGKLVFENTGYNYTDTGDYELDQLMVCPQLGSYLKYHFIYAEDQTQDIIADPDVVPLDDYKHLYNEAFSFEERIPGKEDPTKYDPCMLYIRNYPLAGKWEFQYHTKSNYGSVEVSAVENPDGSICFSQGGKQWNFHREGDYIIFDGGSTLMAGNWNGIKEREYLEMEVPVGTVFRTFGEKYVYDALYILPGKTLEECYTAIQLDTKNQWVKIQCWDGKVLRGPFTYGDEYCNYIVFNCEVPDYTGMGTRTVQIDLMPNDHALCIRNPWMMSICPDGLSESNYFYLFPVQGVTPQETIEE